MFSSVVVLLLLFNCYGHGRQLIGTHILFRHGERAPTMLYRSDPNDPFFWPNGLGSLTIRGKLQHIRLGQYFRERYSTLLNSTYVASEITIRSSDYDRTLMSAYSTLVGLYPSSKSNLSIQNSIESNIWPETLPWQPVPVHTVPKSIDHLMGVSNCARYTALVEQTKKSERIQSINNQFRDLFQYLEKNAGQSVPDLFAAWEISDTIVVEDVYNITPSWVTPPILSQLRLISDISAYHLMQMFDINRLRGPLLRDILENVQDLTSNSSKGRKARIYSGHETTIAAILSFLGVNYPHQPPHASALFFDLYQQDDRSYDIQLEYLNTTNGRITHPILLPGCPSTMCPVMTLRRLFQNKWPDNVDKECQISGANELISSRRLGFLHLVMVFAILCVLSYV